MTTLGISLAALALAAAPVDHAPSADAKARTAFEAGQQLYRLARYAEAIERFKQANALKPNPSLLFNIGKCHEQLGQVPEALAAYREYLKLAPDAADHTIVSQAVTNLERRYEDHEAPPPPPPPPPEDAPLAGALTPVDAPSEGVVAAAQVPRHRVVTWIAAGATVVAAGVAVGLGVTANSASSQLRDGTVRDHLAAQGLSDQTHSMATGANVATGVAVAVGVTAVVLFFLEGR